MFRTGPGLFYFLGPAFFHLRTRLQARPHPLGQLSVHGRRPGHSVLCCSSAIQWFCVALLQGLPRHGHGLLCGPDPSLVRGREWDVTSHRRGKAYKFPSSAVLFLSHLSKINAVQPAKNSFFPGSRLPNAVRSINRDISDNCSQLERISGDRWS